MGSLPLAHNAQHSLVGRAGASPPSRTTGPRCLNIYIYVFGRAGASPPSRTAVIIFLYIYICVVRRALNVLRASFSPIF